MANTLIIYRGDGSTTDFAVPFDYLRKSFVKVLLDSVTELKGGSTTDTSADYYFVDATTIRLRKIVPTTEQTITIRRYTSVKERVASFRDGSVLYSKDLDTAQVQAFHIAEEARDVINDALVADRENNWDARNKRIINVGTPVADNDAMTYGIYKADALGALHSKLDAEKARDRAVEAETNSKKSEEVVTSAATFIGSIAPEIKIVADNIDSVVTDSNSISNINIVGNDLTGSLSDTLYDDYGDLGNPTAPSPTITGGNIKVVSDNIESVRTVAGLAPDFETVIESVNTVTSLTVRAENASKSAETSATNASSSEANAQASKVSASGSASLAKDWANKMEGTVDDTEYSAKYYANKAKTDAGQADASAKSSASSATTATEQATASANSAKAAKLSEDTAATHKESASSSAAKAKASEVEAKKQADLARSYADQASTGQLQSDWNQSDSTQKDFIKNKPDLSIYATATALTEGLAGKANKAHTHDVADVTGLQTALDGKANTSHTHTVANVTGLQDALNGKLSVATFEGFVDYGDLGTP